MPSAAASQMEGVNDAALLPFAWAKARYVHLQRPLDQRWRWGGSGRAAYPRSHRVVDEAVGHRLGAVGNHQVAFDQCCGSAVVVFFLLLLTSTTIGSPSG